MRYVKDSPLELGFRIWQLRPPQPSLTVAVKGTFDPLRGDPAPFAEEQVPVTGEMYVDDDVEQPLRMPSDLALLKPAGEVMVVGKAWAAGRRSTNVLGCSFKIGPIEKRFAVVGDRHWVPGLVDRISETRPFTEMELHMGRAFGGPGFAKNPWGRGRVPEPLEDGATARRLPNLEQADDPVDHMDEIVEPVVLGPLPTTWPARMALAGTYDTAYARDRWPWLPKDFDWRFFQEAPPDQRLREGYFRGDERVEVTGLHPEVPQLRSRLPAIAPRVFADLTRPGHEPSFEEVPLRLDTVVWDGETGKLLCTWRGVLEIPSETLDEVRHLFVAHDPLGGPRRDAATLRARCEELLRLEEEEEEEAEGDEPPSFDDDTAVDETAEEEEAEEAEVEVAAPEPTPEEVEAERKLAELDANLAKLGLPLVGDPQKSDPRAMLAALEASGVAVAPDLAALVAALDEPEESPAPPEPDPEPEDEAALEGRALVEAKLAAGEPLTELDLTGADLSGMDLSRQDLMGSILRGANLRDAKLREARLRDCALAEASLVHVELAGADAGAADFTGADLSGADLIHANVSESDFTGARLVSVRLQSVNAVGALFTEANLEGSLMAGGDFREADFERANLRRVNAVEADLSDATLEGAVADGAVFDKAVMVKTRAEGLSAVEARFGGITADDSFWEESDLSRADFSFAKLARADFSGAALIGAELDACTLRGARLERAKAHSLRARRADLMEASLESADLTFADLRGANLYAANLWRAKLDDAQLATANLEGTLLEP